MKNKHLLLTLLLALFAPWAAQAQETLTVYEEATETSEYVPFYGYYADESQQDQMIYPASELTAMVGMEIIQMVFYIDDKDGSRDIGEWIVSLGETTATTLIGLDLTTPLTEVYSGKMIFDSDETLMTVTFANGYIYNGGNLLVEFNHPVTESYKHYYFLGVEATGASYCYDEQQNFLPKVTFSYQNPPACPKPMGVTATAPTAHGATVSWTGSSDSYILILGQASTFGSYNFESNSIPAAFTNSTSYPWTVVANTHSGGYCVKSGNAGVNSTTSDLVLEVNLTSAGSVSFSALASSESNWDFGRFLIDGTQQFQTSGTTNSWADYSFDLAAGSHTLTWSFEKDSGTDYGDDCFYVDDIKINLNPTTWDETHTASASPYTFTDLDTETSYLVMVKGVCGSEQSEPSAAVSFTTLVSCPAPQNLTVTTDNVTATATWTGTEGTCNIDINGTVTNDVTSPYTFNVELSTTYNVKVQANCEGETSSWTAPFTFTTHDCLGGHTIEYTLTDSWGDGWTGNAIILKDACDVLETLTIANGYTNSGTLTLCGDYYQLTWQTGEDADETSFTLIVDGAAIYTNQSGENLSDGQVLYTIGTAPTMLPKPTDLTAGTPESRSVELSWTENGEATTWELCVNGDESNPVAANSNPFTLDGLNALTTYTVKVRSTNGTNESCWSDEITFTTPDACAAPTGLTAEVTVNAAELSWTGVTDTYNLRYCEVDPTASATIILNVPNDVWGDGSGYQMLLDADATAYDDIDFSDYSIFEYLIPTDVTYDPNTTGIVINNSVTIQIPAGTYDWMVTNPSPDWNDVYVAGSNGNVNGAENNFVFEAGKTYEFTLFLVSNSDGDGVNLTITGDANAWTLVEGVTNPYTLENLSAQTMYEYQVQGVDCDGNGGTTDWSASANFTTGEFYTKTIEPYDEHGWYLIASPLAAETNPTDVENLIPANANNYALYRFNQDADLEWENYKAHTFNLEPGKGYLYANNTEGGVDLIFTGAAYDGDSKEVTLHKTAGAEFEGMNLVGNPFAEDAYIDRDYYTMNSTGTEIMTTPSTGAIGAMQGVFVEANSDGETLTFSKQEPTGNKGLVLNLSQGRGVIDRAVIRFGTDRMLHKFVLNENSTKMYIPKAGEDFAVVRSLNSDEVTVSFEPAEDDIYSISINVENLIVRSLILTDKVERVNIDMLHTPSYQFKASTTDPIDRFVLTFKTGPSQFKELFIAGGKSGDFGFFSNGSWMIDNEGEATLQVIDMIGRVLSSETINGSASINVDVAPGVYMLRLINGENVKVQKIVVR